MVKNKKMSKTSIAVIVLAVLLVLSLVMGLTGAWFTSNANDKTTGKGNSVQFGVFGDAAVTLTGAQWKEHALGVAAQSDVSGRNYYMPGDYVQAAGVKIEYVGGESAAAEDNHVFYVIGIKHVGDATATDATLGNETFTWYKDNSGLVACEGVAGDLAVALADHDGNNATAQKVYGKIELGGQVATVTIDNVVYDLDGDITSAAATGDNHKHSWEIPNAGEGHTLDAVTGIFQDGRTMYEVRMIQSTNLNATEAYGILTNANWGQVAATIA